MSERRIWTAKERQFIRDTREESPELVAKRLGTTPRKIYSARYKFNATNRRKWTNEEVNAILLPLYESGMSDRRLAISSGFTRRRVKTWRESKGLLPLGNTDTSVRMWKHTRKRRKRNKRRREQESERNLREIERNNYQENNALPTAIGALKVHTEEQSLWLKAILSFREEHKRPPTLIEAFRLAISLGYTKAPNDTLSDSRSETSDSSSIHSPFSSTQSDIPSE